MKWIQIQDLKFILCKSLYFLFTKLKYWQPTVVDWLHQRSQLMASPNPRHGQFHFAGAM